MLFSALSLGALPDPHSEDLGESCRKQMREEVEIYKQAQSFLFLTPVLKENYSTKAK